MSRLNKNEKILLAILGVVIVGYLYYTFLLNPVLNKISIANDNISNYKSEIVSLTTKEAETKNLQKQYDAMKLKYDQVIKSYPKYQKDPQIAYDIKALAAKYSITLSSVNFSEPNKVEDKTSGNKTDNTAKSNVYGLYNVAVNITSAGTFINMKDFIKALEGEQRSTEIVTTSLIAGENSVNASLTANYYFITDSNNKEKDSYSFNKGSYGKTDLFK